MRQLLGHSCYLHAHLVLVSRYVPSQPCAWPACREVGRRQLAYGSRPLHSGHVRTAASRDDLLKGVSPEHRDDVARAVELAQRAANQWTTLVTGHGLLSHSVHAQSILLRLLS